MIFLAPLYAVAMTYMMHKDTLGEDALMLQIACTIVILFSAYSLVSLPIPESTPYNTNDSFSLFSHHYQRLEWSILLAFILAVLEIFEANIDKHDWRTGPKKE